MGKKVEVTAVVPFGDHEDTVGSACRRIGSYLASCELSYELIAVEENSCDSSRFVLSVLASSMPQLRVTSAKPGRRLSVAAKMATGRVLWYLSHSAALESELSDFWPAYEVLAADKADVTTGDSFSLFRRVAAKDLLTGTNRWNAKGFERRLRSSGLRVRTLEVDAGLKNLG